MERFKRILALPFLPLTWTYSGLRSLVQRTVQPLVYQASAGKFKKKMDGDRLEHSRARLRELGGETILIRTEDGGVIEGMFFDVENVRKAIVAQGGQFLIDQDTGKYYLRSYSPDLTELLTDTLKLEGEEIYDPYDDEGRPTQFELPFANESAATGTNKQVTILTQGNACIFEMDRESIGSVLMSGKSCMVFNLRGTGRSHGVPNEERTYQDIEGVCQFLHTKGFSDSQIAAHGYCLGAGLAVDLASRRFMKLFLDRPFAQIGDVMAGFVADTIDPDEIIEQLGLKPDSSMAIRLKTILNERVTACLKTVAQWVIPTGANWAVMSYNNANKLKNVRGSIVYIHSDKDEVIPKASRERMRKVIASMPNATIQTSEEFGHNDSWDQETTEVFQTHQIDYGISRRHAPTLPPARIIFSRLNHKPWSAERAAESRRVTRDASLVGGGILAVGPPGAAAGMVLVASARKFDRNRRRCVRDAVF